MRTVKHENAEIDFVAAVMLMDDEIRKNIHSLMAPCADQEFFDEYCIRHLVKYGEDFEVN